MGCLLAKVARVGRLDHFRVVVTLILGTSALALCPGPARGQLLIDGIAAVVNDKVITFQQIKPQVAETEKLLQPESAGRGAAGARQGSAAQRAQGADRPRADHPGLQEAGRHHPRHLRQRAHQRRDPRALRRRPHGLHQDPLRARRDHGQVPRRHRRTTPSSSTCARATSPRPSSSRPTRSSSTTSRTCASSSRTSRSRSAPSCCASRSSPPPRPVDGKQVSYDPQEEIAKEILYKLDTGADFADLAKSYSEAPQQGRRRRARLGDAERQARHPLRSLALHRQAAARPAHRRHLHRRRLLLHRRGRGPHQGLDHAASTTCASRSRKRSSSQESQSASRSGSTASAPRPTSRCSCRTA